MTDVKPHTEGWEMLPWKQFERTIFRLQKRIYKASLRGPSGCGSVRVGGGVTRLPTLIRQSPFTLCLWL